MIEFAIPFFRHCRSVLVMPCAGARDLAPYAEAGMMAVGGHPDRRVVDRCWRRNELVWCTTPERLAAYPERFDAAAVSLTALGLGPDEVEAAVRGLAETLHDGGRLVLEGSPELLAKAEAACDPSLLSFGGDGKLLAARRRRRREAEPDPIAVNGPPTGTFGDLLMGYGSVLELGAGVGRMLDALALREIECAGFDADPELASAARQRGQRMLEFDALLASGPWGAVFVGPAVDGLASPQRLELMESCASLLRPGGRLVISVLAEARDDFVAAAQRAGLERATYDGYADAADRCRFRARSPDARARPGHTVDRADAVRRLTGRGLPIQEPQQNVFDLERFERRVHSQGGEDGVLESLFEHLGTTNRFYVELGCGDGVQCNTAALRERGWRGLLVDGVEAPAAPEIPLVNAWITADSVNALLDAHEVPMEPDLLSLDIDGNDYWVWQALDRRPRVLVAEYNGNLPAHRALTVPYEPHRTWDGTDHYGASLAALVRLGREKGYTLCYCTQAGVNAVFVRDDLVDAPAPSPLALWRPANFWYRGGRQVPNLEGRWVEFEPLPDDGTGVRPCGPAC